MGTTSRRVRRLGGLLLLAATVWWAFVRRRANAVRWVEPPATLPTGGRPTGGVPAEPGPPGEMPEDVLATDAGLTEFPEPAADEATADTVDEARVAELLAESPDADVVVVDETTYEQVIADAAAEARSGATAPAGEVEAEVVAAGPAEAEPGDGTTETGPAAAADDEPTERGLAAPGVDEPTVSIRPDPGEAARLGTAVPTFSEATTEEIPAVSDDLRAVRGIGPSMERTLHSLGIVSYRQLAMLDGPGLEQVRAELADFRGRIEREDWIGQARTLHRQKYGEDPA